jgi:hypothetical protein
VRKSTKRNRREAKERDAQGLDTFTVASAAAMIAYLQRNPEVLAAARAIPDRADRKAFVRAAMKEAMA